MICHRRTAIGRAHIVSPPRGRYLFRLWMNVWVAGKTVTLVLPERRGDESLAIKRYTYIRLLYFTYTLRAMYKCSFWGAVVFFYSDFLLRCFDQLNFEFVSRVCSVISFSGF